MDVDSGRLCRARISDSVLKVLISCPCVPSDVLRRAILEQQAEKFITDESKVLPAETGDVPVVEIGNFPIGKQHREDTKRQLSGSTDDGGCTASAGKVSKFTKFKKAVSSPFACFPFRKRTLAVQE